MHAPRSPTGHASCAHDWTRCRWKICRCSPPSRNNDRPPHRPGGVMHRQLLPAALCAGLLVTGVGTAIAGDRGPLDQDIQISLGAFFVTTGTKVRLDGENGSTGTNINWENEFDLKDKDRFRLDAFWRFAERHKVPLM